MLMHYGEDRRMPRDTFSAMRESDHSRSDSARNRMLIYSAFAPIRLLKNSRNPSESAFLTNQTRE